MYSGRWTFKSSAGIDDASLFDRAASPTVDLGRSTAPAYYNLGTKLQYLSVIVDYSFGISLLSKEILCKVLSWW